jgi:hypothetical protein
MNTATINDRDMSIEELIVLDTLQFVTQLRSDYLMVAPILAIIPRTSPASCYHSHFGMVAGELPAIWHPQTTRECKLYV